MEQTLSSATVYEGLVVTILNDEVLLSNQKKAKREVIRHSGGVVVVAQIENKILLVKQYRYCVKEAMYELPAGKLERGEDVLFAAKRELLEETGYRADKWQSLGFIYPTAGISDEKLHLLKADDLTFVEQQPDENEIIDYMLVDLEQVYEMIKTGIINDAKTICGIARAFAL